LRSRTSRLTDTGGAGVKEVSAGDHKIALFVKSVDELSAEDVNLSMQGLALV